MVRGEIEGIDEAPAVAAIDVVADNLNILEQFEHCRGTIHGAVIDNEDVLRKLTGTSEHGGDVDFLVEYRDRD
jgi:hypothetical protein